MVIVEGGTEGRAREEAKETGGKGEQGSLALVDSPVLHENGEGRRRRRRSTYPCQVRLSLGQSEVHSQADGPYTWV